MTNRIFSLSLWATLALYVVVTAGGIVCITGSGAGCGGWPRCAGQIVPPARADAIIEYVHRLIAALTGLMVIAAAVAGWRKRGSGWWIKRAPAVAGVCVLLSALLGAIAVTRGISPLVAAIDRGCALAGLALMLTSSLVALPGTNRSAGQGRLVFHSPLARVTLGSCIVVFVLLITGVLAVADTTSAARCFGWPVDGWALFSGAVRPWPEMARQGLAVLSGVLLAASVVGAWVTQRKQRGILAAATIAGLLFVAELALGATLSLATASLPALVLSVATMSAFWTSLVVLVVLTGRFGS